MQERDGIEFERESGADVFLWQSTIGKNQE